MKLLDLLAGGFETKVFPEGDCTVQNEREPEVLDSNAWFLCLTVDKDSSSYGRLSVLKPYTARNLPEAIEEGEPSILFGWVDRDGNIRDHFERNVHDDDELVVAWKRLDGPADLRELAGLAQG